MRIVRLYSFHVSFLMYSPYIVQKSEFLQFCIDLNKKRKSVKAIYIYSSESCHYTLSENYMVYWCLRHRS